MKKFIVILSVAIFASFVTSCSSEPQTPEKKVTTTVSTTTAKADPGSYFLVKKEIRVKHGETVWGYAKVEYKDGFRWRDIVAQNPFLLEQGRVYKNANGRWIVKIYDDENIIMGTEVVNPTDYTISEKTTTTEVTIPGSEKTPLWMWFIIGLFGLSVIIAAIAVLFPNRNNRNGSASSIIHVNIGHHGQGIDAATHVATAEANNASSERFRAHVATQMLNNPNLTHAHLSESSDQNQRFELHADYDPQALQPRQQ